MLVAELGADAIGMIFNSKSPRCIQMDQASEITRQMPAFVTRVGVFVDSNASYLITILNEVKLDLLQFHGSESAEFCGSFGLPYIKAVQMDDKIELVDIAREFHTCRAILVDTHHPTLAGGTGEVFDWNRLPEALNKPIILAGGLNPDNVGEAIRAASPYAVDVSSGVEKSKGLKDPEKVKKFIQAIT